MIAAAAAVALGAVVLPAALLILWPMPVSYSRPPSRVALYADGTPVRHYITADGKWRIRSGIDEIDPLLRKATICYEDRFFEYHPGINPASLLRAAVQNIRSGKVVSGGSTITMQLARVLEPRPRTLASKISQAFRAVQLEARLGKNAILERYLGEAPYGGNLEGVAAASWAYYGKSPASLTVAETAYLVSLPQSPSKRHPGRGNEDATRSARDRVIGRMARCGLIGEQAAVEAKNEPIPSRVRPQPFSAPHAADYLFAGGRGGETRIASTLDRRIQARAERLLGSYRSRLEMLGAMNAAVVVMENSTRNVKALVGNTDFFDERNYGQVNGFDAPRSPGSALKPFLYAMAVQDGEISPDSLLEDAPVQLAGFKPLNFNGRYEGLVRAERALSHSLNIPFVLLLQRTGLERFLTLLRDGGIELGGSGRYGLSVITGGVETTLLDLANLYATLANGGMHGGYRLRPGGIPMPERRLFKEGAVHLARRALMIRDRPDAPLVGLATLQDGRIAWKTGTSWGFRDAWAIGFNTQYTVGVWAGNFNGRPSPGIVGAQAAAPIMFDVIRAVTTDWREFPAPPPGELEYARVCSESGYRATPHCPGTRQVLALRDASPSRECPFHRQFMVEKETGARTCLWKVYKSDEVEMRTMTVYPPSVSQVLGGTGRPPPYAAGCSVRAPGDTLRIISPSGNVTYINDGGIRNTGNIPLQAFTTARDGLVSWFINDLFIGETRSGEVRLVSLPSGQSRIVAENSSGHREHADVTVSAP
jgi:penicillin-binding protein 1C